MIRGIHSSVQAMRAHLAKQEVVARNLANLLTPGYKQETPVVDGFSAIVSRVENRADLVAATPASATGPRIGGLSLGVAVSRISIDFRQGPLEETNRPLDVALLGDGFLRVRTAEGSFFSRGGPLHLDADGRLVTPEGYSVLGPEGEVILPGGDVALESDGTILADGRPVGRLAVVEFQPGTRMTKIGEGLFAPEDPSGAEPVAAALTEVKSGFLERSNVDEVSAMTELVQSLRAYQACQRMLQAQDELLGKAVNEVGRF